MFFLIQAPNDKARPNELVALVARGEGLSWVVSALPLANLFDYAKSNTHFENVELKLLYGNQKPTANDPLIYGYEGKTRLWIDTKPMASARLTPYKDPKRFISQLAVILQEVRSSAGTTLGYVVAFPDQRVLRIAVNDILKYCESARVQGKSAVQNMQYVPANGQTTAHLKNYEGRTVPVYIQERKAVNAEAKTLPAPKPVASAASSVFTPEQLEVLGKGKAEGLDIRVYANPALSPKHMNTIRKILLAGKDPLLVLDPELAPELVSLYGSDLAQGANIRPYFNKKYTLKQAVQVKLGTIRGLDISQYADPSVDGDEMEQRRVRLDADTWNNILNS